MAGNWRTTKKCPTLEFCCCCVPLKIGGVIVGVLDIILLILLSYKDIESLNASPTNQTKNETLTEPSSDLISYEGDLIMFLVLNYILIFVVLCFFFGLFKEKPIFMLPIVITTLIRLIYLTVSVIYSNGILTYLGLGVHWIEYLGQILFLYCWLVEYSLYKRVRATVKERNQSGQGTENGPESQQLN